MTDEEALDWLEARKEHYELDDNCQELAEALYIGIKALKNQKSIIEELEKIKSEIMSIGNWREITEVPNGYVVECLNIVDKQIAELKGE